MYRGRCTAVDLPLPWCRGRGVPSPGAQGGFDDASETVATSDAPAGELVKLVRNFRSHDEVLRYVARVFDGDTGGLMQGFLDLEPSDDREDKLKAKASRRQALLVAGGSTQERTQAKARAIAERFQAARLKPGRAPGRMGTASWGRMTTPTSTPRLSATKDSTA